MEPDPPSGPPAALDNQSPELFGQTPWQTVGPFFHYGLPWKGGADLVAQSELGARPDLFPAEHDVLNLSPPREPVTGEVVVLIGAVRDGEGEPVPDAMLEIWGANAAGRYRSPDDPRSDPPIDPGFVGFGRAATDADGWYRFHTLRPGPVPGHDGRPQAPHVAVGVFGRGLIKRLVTRLYFADDARTLDDAVLALVPATRRGTLLAARVAVDPATYRFDIVLQGEGETVFFEC